MLLPLILFTSIIIFMMFLRVASMNNEILVLKETLNENITRTEVETMFSEKDKDV